MSAPAVALADDFRAVMAGVATPVAVVSTLTGECRTARP